MVILFCERWVNSNYNDDGYYLYYDDDHDDDDGDDGYDNEFDFC